VIYLIRKYVLKRVYDEEELIDTLKVRVYETLLERPFDGSRSNFGSYVYSIVRNGITKFLSKKKSYPTDEFHNATKDNFVFDRVVFRPTALYLKLYGPVKGYVKLANSFIRKGLVDTMECLPDDIIDMVKTIFWYNYGVKRKIDVSF
jgi:hypothetical protein